MDSTPVKQAFGSPGGKSYLAERIVKMMPEHEVYVEPFAGCAAVFFKKPPAKKEILNDKDVDIAFAFRFLRDMTPDQFEKLQKLDWVWDKSTFRRLQNSKPQSDIEKFHKFYYLRKASFASGEKTFNYARQGKTIGTDHLWKVHERLKNTRIWDDNAVNLIKRYDSPKTLFYLDPPYPTRSFVGQKFDTYTEDDLKKLTDELQGIKGKFILSLSTEHEKLLPQSFNVHRAKVHRMMSIAGKDFNKTNQYEIIATNMRKLPPISRHAPRISPRELRISPREIRITPKERRIS